MGDLNIFGDVSSELDERQYQGPGVDPDMVLLEAPDGAWKEAWVIDSTNGCLMSLGGLAAHRGESVEELRGQLREVVTGDAGDAAYDAGDAAYDAGDGTGAGVTGGGDGGDTGGGMGCDIAVEAVSTDELDADLDQGTVRKSIRGLDQGAVAAIREVTGASSDAEAVRKAVLLVKDAVVTN